MTVYISMYASYDEREIYGVYSSRSLAEQGIKEAIKILNLDPCEYDFDIQEYEVEDEEVKNDS